MTKYKCEDCERVIKAKRSLFKTICEKCEGGMVRVDDNESLFEGKKEKEVINKDDDDWKPDKAICPFCEAEITKVIQRSLEINDTRCELICCPECNKIFGLLEW